MSDVRDPERDQQLPAAVEGPIMHDLVAADLMERKAFGTAKYGQPLRAHNGRSFLLDAYEETLDLLVYLRGKLVEEGTLPTSLPVRGADGGVPTPVEVLTEFVNEFSVRSRHASSNTDAELVGLAVAKYGVPLEAIYGDDTPPAIVLQMIGAARLGYLDGDGTGE